jgi:hypothetical protein
MDKHGYPESLSSPNGTPLANIDDLRARFFANFEVFMFHFLRVCLDVGS